jgi:hypothetical protein
VPFVPADLVGLFLLYLPRCQAAPVPETKKAVAAPVPMRMTMAKRNKAQYQELPAARQRRLAERGPAWSRSIGADC